MYSGRGPEAAPLIQFNNSIVTGGTYTAYAASNDDDSVPISTGRRRGADGSFRFNAGPQSLEDIVAFDALLNSNERYPAPRCHPDTRKAALEILINWIWNQRAGFRSVMWVSGGPGVGKSALLQTVCEVLAGAYNPIHASFFFGRGQGARELAASLPPTIAYQFTITSIVCRWYTWYLLRNDPTILREAFHSQFRKLVTAPATARSYVQHPMVVVIDGLDECIDVRDRVSLLELIFEAANTKSIRFLIASRPEQEIETFFKRPDVAQLVDHIILDEETFKTSKDIRIFLRSEFGRIRESRPDLTFDVIDGVEWPGDAIIDRATVDSDGQFIFATLFIGYLDDDLFSPQEQLEILLNPPANAAAFSKLDRLYHQILTRRPRHMDENDVKFVQHQKTVKRILSAVFAWPVQLSIAGIAKLLGEEIHVVQNLVRGPLRTLFKVQGPVTPRKIAFCHKSLGDCLSDPQRSGEFHVPPNTLDLLYHRILSRPPPSDPSQTFSREQIIGVLRVLVAWPDRCREDQIAAVLGVDSGTVRRIVSPLIGLLLRRNEQGGIYFCWQVFEDFLADPKRSEEFHVPPNALDLLYHRLLSHPAPSEPSQTFSREQLVGVLHVLAAWPCFCGEDEIATILGWGGGIVSRVVAPFMGLLFNRSEKESHIWIFLQDFKDFLADPHRSVEFHVPPNALDLLYHRLLSSHSQTSREHLIGVLHVLVEWPWWCRDGDIAAVVGLDSETVGRVVAPFMGLLLKRVEKDGCIFFLWQTFQDFLVDPQRSGEFHVPPNAADLLIHGIISRPSQTFSREQLVEVLHVLAAWPCFCGEDEIATILGWESDVVSRVVAPFMGLLFNRSEKQGGVWMLWQGFKDYLVDPHRSGEFHVPPNALDLLYHRILSRLSQISREHLIGVLPVLVAWPRWCRDDDITTVVGLDSETVGRVVAPFMGPLLLKNKEEGVYIRWKSFQCFLVDPHRSGEFHVPPNALDLLYHRLLSHPAPSEPSQTFSREQLVGVLHVLAAWPCFCGEDEIATILGWESDVVSRVVAPFMGLLFNRSEKQGGVWMLWQGFKDYLVDPHRSGEFHVPPNALDLLYHRLLSRSSQTSREHLIGVLQVLTAWPWWCRDDDIAAVVGLDSETVGRVVAPFMGLLLLKNKAECVYIRWKSFQGFLADARRSGEFHVPPNALDLLYHRILSRISQISREHLFGVLPVLVAWPWCCRDDDIATVVGLDNETVGRVVAPFMGPLFIKPKEECVYIRWKSFRGFLVDPRRSGKFHVPPNALDLLYHRLLTHPPPSESLRTFSREQLIRVLHVLVALPYTPSEGQIASFLGFDSDTVGRIVTPFLGLLFGRCDDKKGVLLLSPFFYFLVDSHRSGEFHVPPNALDLLYHRLLSHPPPSESLQTFSREQLIGVLHVLVACPYMLSEGQIASFLGFDSDTVGRIVTPFLGLLFGRCDDKKGVLLLSPFFYFLVDPHRSGEFHVPPNALDLLYHRLLSRPPPSDPSQTFSHEDLLAVLHSAIMSSLDAWSCALTRGAPSPNIPSYIVQKVTSGPLHLIFLQSEDGSRFLFHYSLLYFLLDPCRSGQFHNPRLSLVTIPPFVELCSLYDAID